MKYGKYIKKTRRTNRATSRLAKKVRRIRSNKRFTRRLNSVAEKKVSTLRYANQGYLYADTAAALDTGLIRATWPAEGTGYNQRVGKKIFIRYINFEMWGFNLNTASSQGVVGLFVAWERTPATMAAIQLTTFFPHAIPILNPDIYKLYAIKKQKLYTRHIWNNTSAAGPIHWKKRFKIFKECQENPNGLPSIPDIYWAPVYFNAGFTGNGESTGVVCVRVTMTYTDI